MEKFRDWLWLVRVLVPHLNWERFRYLWPHNGNLKVGRRLRRVKRRIARFVEVDPARLELPVLTLGQVKWSKGNHPDPAEWTQVYEPFWHVPELQGRYGRRIEESFYIEFLDMYETHKSRFDVRKTAYYRYLQGLMLLGIKRRANYPESRCHRFLRLYDRIKTCGYSYEYLYHYIGVRSTPWVTLRFGIMVPHDYYEIANGRHRAAIAAFLGMSSIRALEWDESETLTGIARRSKVWVPDPMRRRAEVSGVTP